MLIETNCLTKVYGAQRAVDSVSMHINKGDIYGLIGKNGAGKTTPMRLLTRTASPTSGSILFEGMPISKMPQVL